jgi:hypothetical protein
MSYIDEQLNKFKKMIEDAIIVGGADGKNACIRTQAPINLIHDAVKLELINHGIREELIFPPFGESKPEIKLAGFLKQKDQDVCVVPKGIKEKSTPIDWGLMAFQNEIDPYGFDFSTNTLVINVRSQMSSLAKNADTLFERTFAEALNLHMRYPNMVLGEVYLIPVYEYDDTEAAKHQVAFKNKHVNVEKYITFFDAINKRQKVEETYKYERCTLLVVDFRPDSPKLYRNSDELKKDGIVSKSFPLEYASLAFDTFTEEIVDIYAERYSIKNIQDINRIKRLTAYEEKMRKVHEKSQ